MGKKGLQKQALSIPPPKKRLSQPLFSSVVVAIVKDKLKLERLGLVCF